MTETEKTMMTTTIDTKPSAWIRAWLYNLAPAGHVTSENHEACMEVCSLSAEWHKIRKGIVIA